MTQKIHGFPPVLGISPRVLIIGSMPSVQSLKNRQYYGHPRNHFWRILFQVLDKPLPAEYDRRLDEIKKSKIALWDALGECRREGSLDHAIEDEVYNDVAGLLIDNPSIRLVVFNGLKAEKAFWQGARGFLPDSSGTTGGLDSLKNRCVFLRLPSTSPIPTRYYKTADDKFDSWKIIADYLDGVEE